MTIDRSKTVRRLDRADRDPWDLIENGLDSQGRRVRLVWSGATGQVYTTAEADLDDHEVLDVYGRVDSLGGARAIADMCVRDAQGRTLLETVQRHLE